MIIRKYTPLDRKAVEHIHFETGFAGRPMSHILTNNKVWRKSISYYLDNEPESAFILEHNGKIYGYLLGCLNDRKNSGIRYYLSYLFMILKGLASFNRKDRIFWRRHLAYALSVLRGKSGDLKLKTPANAGHFHINLLPEARGKSYGSKMLKVFEDYAKENGTKMIHAESFQSEAYASTNFWSKNKFRELDRKESLCWKYYIPHRMSLVCNAKKL